MLLSNVLAPLQVGDTPADTIMGQAANLGLTIGVLTGVGSHQDLVDADIIVQVESAEIACFIFYEN